MEYCDLLLVLAPVFGLSLYCLAHVCLSRRGGWSNRYRPLVWGCLVGLLGTVAISLTTLLSSGKGLFDAAALIALNAAIFLAFAFGYFNFVNVNIASLRIRILLELQSRSGQSREELLAGYNSRQVLGLRIRRLTAGQHLREQQGRFYRGPARRFLILARTYDLLRWMILGRRPPWKA